MVENDNSDALRVVAELTASSQRYRSQFVIWLGLGSAGGAAALLSLAAALPDPDHALRLLLPALACFTLGVAAAALSVLFVGLRDGAGAIHHGEAHNRAQFANAIRRIPEVFAAPPSLAKSANAERDALIERNTSAHDAAELAWIRRKRWDVAFKAAVTLSAGAFVAGAVWPLYLTGSGQRLGIGCAETISPASGTPSKSAYGTGGT